MSFYEKKKRKEQAKSISELSDILGEEIDMEVQKSTYLPVLHLILGTIIVGGSIILGNACLSYGLLAAFIGSGLWIIGKN